MLCFFLFFIPHFFPSFFWPPFFPFIFIAPFYFSIWLPRIVQFTASLTGSGAVDRMAVNQELHPPSWIFFKPFSEVDFFFFFFSVWCNFCCFSNVESCKIFFWSWNETQTMISLIRKIIFKVLGVFQQP